MRDLFRKYIKIGIMWPQLRGPLGVTLLSSSLKDNCLHELLSGTLYLSSEEIKRTCNLANRLHTQAGIRANKVDHFAIHLDWKRSINAASFIFRVFSGERGFHEYNPGAVHLLAQSEISTISLNSSNRNWWDVMAVTLSNIEEELLQKRMESQIFQLSFSSLPHRLQWMNRNGQNDCRLDLLNENPTQLRRVILQRIKDNLLGKTSTYNRNYIYEHILDIDQRYFQFDRSAFG